MENEGQLPSPRSLKVATSRKRLSTPRRSEHEGNFASWSDPTTAWKTNGDPFLDVQSVAEENEQAEFSDDTARLPRRTLSPHNLPFAEDGSNYDSDSDSDTSDGPHSPISPEASEQKASEPLINRIPPIPLLYRNVLKCSIAYFIASLFTFSPYLSSFISDLTSRDPGPHTPLPSGYMVATIAVYFNPAKTNGGMIEADVFCLVGLLYSAFVCLSSMSLFWWLELQPGWEWLGDLVAIVWIGVSMSGVAWAKVWMASPSFNTACSMTAIIIFVVLVKEGGSITLLHVSTIVLCGSLISNLVCYVIWPQSALSNLQRDMTKSLDSFSTVLSMLTRTFLLEGEVHKRHHLEKMQQAVENHQSSFTSLKKSLSEARTEWIYRGGEVNPSGENTGKQAYGDAVDSLNRLGQHLNGLRSGTRLQYDLTKAGVVKVKNRKRGKKSNLPAAFDVPAEDDEEKAMLKAAAVMFGDLVTDLGPPLKALSTACTSALTHLRVAFEQSQSQKKKKGMFQPGEFIELVDGIERALVRFESTSNHAVLRLYRKSEILIYSRPQSVASETLSVRGDDLDNSLLMGGDNEHVFLVYFFIFTLQEFSMEMISLIDAIGRIYNYEQARVNQEAWWRRLLGAIRRGVHRCMMWCRFRSSTSTTSKKHPSLKRSLSAYIIPDHRRPVASFPKVRPHAPNTIQTPPRNKLPLVGRIKQTLWEVGKRLAERDTKYAFKAGMATAMLAAPAFFDATRPIFVENWGDWALVSFFIVISPTIGATNYLSLQRVLGTLFGAAVAAGIFSLCPDAPVLLSVFGFFFSLPCFYYGLSNPQYLAASRFVLLTYNLSCLYSYNLRQKDISVLDIALHRAIAVIVGVIWAAFVSRFWWPAEARRELGKALSEFCLNMGWLYTRLVASNSFAPEYHAADGNEDAANADLDEVALLHVHSQRTRLNNSVKEFMAMELHLQIKLIELQGLLAQTQHEPRLKGPFPVTLYRGVLTSLQTILDKLHSMRCVTTREEWYTSVRQDFIIPVNKERHEMVGNIILSLSILSSAFRLKAPLPPYLPPVEKARQRLVDAIRKLDVVKNRDVKGSRQLLFFAYALTMKGVTEELESLGRTLQTAFGVIGQTPEEFEALFMNPEESRKRIDYAA